VDGEFKNILLITHTRAHGQRSPKYVCTMHVVTATNSVSGLCEKLVQDFS